MDWTQIEKDFINHCIDNPPFMSHLEVVAWFKQRIERELPPQPPEKLNEEEKNEFYTTNVTAEIKPKYGK